MMKHFDGFLAKSFWILLIFYFYKTSLFNYKYNISFGIKSKEFRVELKDINISYYFYGYGEHSCKKDSNVFIATLSRPNAFYLRTQIRRSWKRDIPSTATHKFFIGTVENNVGVRRMLEKESKIFGDIIFTSITDSYLNLTLKMNSLYQFQQNYCSNVDFFLRADEDTFLVGSRFEYWLNKEFYKISKQLDENVMFGHVLHQSPVLRNPYERWYVSWESYNETFYPDYLGGPCYLATSKSIKLILEEAKNHKHMTVDDGFYTGIIRDAAGIKVYNGSRHFGFAYSLSQWDHSCDQNGIPFLFSIVDEDGEYEKLQGGYNRAMNKFRKNSCATFE